MTRTEVRTFLQQHQEALNRHDVGALAAMYAEDALLESPMFDTTRGRDAIARSFVRLFEVFPDYVVEMRDALFIHEGNRAAQFSRVTGTQHADLYGVAPTGQTVEYQAARLFTFRDGRISAEQRIYDFGGLIDRIEKNRLDRELSTASAVQQTLTGRARSKGAFFEIITSSLPCRAIGGDFVECLDLPSGDFGLAVGDVSGKGPAAALIAAMLQGMFSMLVGEDTLPESALLRLNRVLYARSIEPRYATLFYGVLAPDGRLTYANAGHTPPLLVTQAGVRLLDVGGPILGVFDGASFPTETITLQPGDTIVAYSDGVTEASPRDGEDFGTDRLASAARARVAARPAAMVEGLLAEVRDFCAGTAPNDDATIAVLRYR